MVDWQIRAYRDGDAAAIAAAQTANFKADGLEIVISEQGLLFDLLHLGVDPARGILVVEGPRVEGLPEGLIPGFGWLGIRDDVNTDERLYGPRVSVHPSARPYGLERELVRRLIEMARAHEAEPGSVPRQTVRVRESFSPRQESQKELYEEIGLQYRRTFWTMKCPLGDLPEPRPVEGVQIRTFRRPEDNAASHKALLHSFIDHYDFHPPSDDPEGRWTARLNRPSFRPELSWVAEVEAEPGKLAGFCFCGIQEEENKDTGRNEGWIETLGTIRGWRGKGLGRSLLLHGLHSLKGEGLDTGVLGVDSENPTGATRLYESVGFYVSDEWLRYSCLLDDVRI